MASQSTYFSCTEDSDATVAPYEDSPMQVCDVAENEESVCNNSVVDSDASMASPSILQPSQPPTAQPEDQSRDVVSCSSEEEILSQEYPPQPQLPQAVPVGSSHAILLCQIESDQATLLADVERVLGNYGDILPMGFVSEVKAKLPALEEKLKSISHAHQTERKKLVAVHSQLSQGSQEGGAGGGVSSKTDSLRSKLVSLSTRQKQLLQCFSKQKEITSKIGILAEREAKAKKTITVEPSKSNPVQLTLPNLVKHLASHNQPHPQHRLQTEVQPCPQMQSQVQPHPQPQSQIQSCLPQIRHGLSQATMEQFGLRAHNQLGQPRPAGQMHSKQDSLSQPAGQIQDSATKSGDSGLGQEGSSGHQDESCKIVGSSQFTQPVPLDMLIQHNILEPGPRSLTCTILGCDFIGSLEKDGSIMEARNPDSPLLAASGEGPAHHHHAPQQWVRSCWAKLGHPHKRITKKQAYNMVVFQGKTLSQHCEFYSRKQVSTFLNQKKATMKAGQNATQRQSTTAVISNKATTSINTSQPQSVSAPAGQNAAQLQSSTATIHSKATTSISTSQPQSVGAPTLPPSAHCSNGVTGSQKPVPSAGDKFDLDSLLFSGEVLLVCDNFQSLEIPAQIRKSFWEENEVALPPQIMNQLEMDLDWPAL